MAKTPKRTAATQPARQSKKPHLSADTATRDPIAVKDRQAMIAEAAYLKAQQRGFMPGHEWQDWYDAEREISAALDQS